MDIFAGRFSNSDEGQRDFATSFALEQRRPFSLKPFCRVSCPFRRARTIRYVQDAIFNRRHPYIVIATAITDIDGEDGLGNIIEGQWRRDDDTCTSMQPVAQTGNR